VTLGDEDEALDTNPPTLFLFEREIVKMLAMGLESMKASSLEKKSVD
jgi:hypothetical protein